MGYSQPIDHTLSCVMRSPLLRQGFSIPCQAHGPRHMGSQRRGYFQLLRQPGPLAAGVHHFFQYPFLPRPRHADIVGQGFQIIQGEVVDLAVEAELVMAGEIAAFVMAEILGR